MILKSTIQNTTTQLTFCAPWFCLANTSPELYFSRYFVAPPWREQIGSAQPFWSLKFKKKCSIQQKLLFLSFQKKMPSLKLTTTHTWKWMVGRRSFPFLGGAGYRPIFKGKLAVRFEALPPAVMKSILWFRYQGTPLPSIQHPLEEATVYGIHAYNTSGITNRSIPPSPRPPKKKYTPRKLTWNPEIDGL